MTAYIGDTIHGRAEVKRVELCGPLTHLLLRRDLWDHSPDGFSWGYVGAGPSQLALAILADASDDQTAQVLHLRFAFEVISFIERDRWLIEKQTVLDWVAHTLRMKPSLARKISELKAGDLVLGELRELPETGG